MADRHERTELWLMGLGKDKKRGEVVTSFLAEAGYPARITGPEELDKARPLGIILDLSPFSADGWGVLLGLKKNPATRDIPIMPVYLSEEGKIGGVFPAAGFFTLPIDPAYLMKKLTVLGFTENVEMWDLQTLVISRKGESNVAMAAEGLGFEVVNAYTGKEAVALATTGRHYLIFCSLMMPDMSAFELLERFRLYPFTRNTPFFVLLKEGMKEGERLAMSRQIEHLVRKKELSKQEFLGYFRRRA